MAPNGNIIYLTKADADGNEVRVKDEMGREIKQRRGTNRTAKRKKRK